MITQEQSIILVAFASIVLLMWITYIQKLEINKLRGDQNVHT